MSRVDHETIKSSNVSLQRRLSTCLSSEVVCDSERCMVFASYLTTCGMVTDGELVLIMVLGFYLRVRQANLCQNKYLLTPLLICIHRHHVPQQSDYPLVERGSLVTRRTQRSDRACIPVSYRTRDPQFPLTEVYAAAGAGCASGAAFSLVGC